MAKSKDDLVYVKWYPSDFIGSTAVQSMDADQIGAYCLLLNHLYMNDGCLPNDHQVLARLSKLGKKWATRGQIVYAQLEVDQTGNLTHSRVKCELQSYKDGKAKRATAGAAGANSRWQTHGKRMANASETDSKSIANSWQNDGIPEARSQKPDSIVNGKPLTPSSPDGDGVQKPVTKTKQPTLPLDEEPDGFDQFWQLYPRKDAKKAAEKAWKRLKQSDRLTCMERLVLFAERWRDLMTEKQFIPHAATWLNQSRWNDELPTGGSKTPLAARSGQGDRFPAKTDTVYREVREVIPGGGYR